MANKSRYVPHLLHPAYGSTCPTICLLKKCCRQGRLIQERRRGSHLFICFACLTGWKLRTRNPLLPIDTGNASHSFQWTKSAARLILNVLPKTPDYFFSLPVFRGGGRTNRHGTSSVPKLDCGRAAARPQFYCQTFLSLLCRQFAIVISCTTKCKNECVFGGFANVDTNG